MNCKQARKYIVPFLDGELADAAEFGAHINACASCRRELVAFQWSFERTVLREVEQEPQIQPDPHLLAKLNRRIDAHEGRSRWADMASRLRRLLTRERMAVVGWAAALILLSVQVGQHVRIETVSHNLYPAEQFAETRVELHIGSVMQVPLIRTVGR